MKKRLLQLLSMILVVTMLLQVCAFATEVDAPAAELPQPLTSETDTATEPEQPAGEEPPAPLASEEPGDGGDPAPVDDPGPDGDKEEEKEKLDIGVDENRWSYPALYFAVENGVLQGNADGDLTPTAYATRAQMATILTRLIRAADTKGNIAVAGADLSAYKDVAGSAWYYKYLSAAVQLGIFNGATPTAMQPDGNITREQAFTVIGRTFGLMDGTKTDLAIFTQDADTVSGYAVPYMAALVKAGYVNGKSATSLKPKDPITREELAQVLYKIFGSGTICSDETAIPDVGTVLYCDEAVPDDTGINGDLILSCDAYPDAAEIEIKGLQLTGTLTVALRDGKTLKLTGCSVKNIVVMSDADVTCDSAVQKLALSGAGASYTGDAADVTIGGNGVKFTGNAKTVSITGNNATIKGTYDTVTAKAANTTAEADSVITKLTLDCAGGTFTLNGNATTAELLQRDCTLKGAGKASTVMQYYKSQTISCSKDKIDTTMLDPGLKDTKISLNTATVTHSAPTAKITATFSGVNGGTGSVNGYRAGQLKWYVDGTLKQTVNISVKNGSTASFSHTYTFSSSTPTSSTVKAEFTYYGETVSSTAKVTINKTVSIPSISGRIAPGDYTTYEKETFVNAKGYTSNTKYLIWQNLYHTKVNVFYGSKGNWDLVKVFDCGIGANKPGYRTPTGQFTLKYAAGNHRWIYGSGSTQWYVDAITVYNGNYAFHTRGKYMRNGAYCFNDLNVMISHGCTRMNTEDAKYIQRLPMGTKVVIY